MQPMCITLDAGPSVSFARRPGPRPARGRRRSLASDAIGLHQRCRSSADAAGGSADPARPTRARCSPCASRWDAGLSVGLRSSPWAATCAKGAGTASASDAVGLHQRRPVVGGRGRPIGDPMQPTHHAGCRPCRATLGSDRASRGPKTPAPAGDEIKRGCRRSRAGSRRRCPAATSRCPSRPDGHRRRSRPTTIPKRWV